MNILLFPRYILKTGVGNHVRELAEELTKQGHKVVVACGEMSLGINVLPPTVRYCKIKTPVKNPLGFVKSLRQLHRIIVEEQIDVVHCHHRIPAIYMAAYNLIYKKVRTVYTLHLMPIPSDWLHRMLTFPGDKAIGVSTDCSRFMVEKLGVPEGKVVTVLNGVNEKELTPLTEEERQAVYEKYHIPQGRYVIAQHCRFDPVKNHMLLVKAAAKMPQELRDKYVFVCSGSKEGAYYEECVTEMKRLGVEDNFVCTGWIDRREILGVADCLVLPSKIEGFGLNCVEAMMMGVLVARSREGGYTDMKDYVLPISNDDEMDVVRLLTEICTNGTGKWDTMRNAAKEWAMRECTVAAMTRHNVDIYKGSPKC